jgi:carbon monoxide dehydrogenase subunit G
MRLEHTFTVPVAVDAAWSVLVDVPRIAPCMPGATLTGFDGESFTGTVRVKLGPITLTYSGKGRFVERDEAAHRVVIEAGGRDTKSAGTASATVTAVLKEDGAATRAEVVTDLTVTGRPAQFGRGMIADVSAKLIGQFAQCLADQLGAGAAGAPAAGAAASSAGAAAAAPAGSTRVPAGEAPDWTAVEPSTEAAPVDLLRLAGGTPQVRRLAAAGAAGLLVLALVWLVTRWLRR